MSDYVGDLEGMGNGEDGGGYLVLLCTEDGGEVICHDGRERDVDVEKKCGETRAEKFVKEIQSSKFVE